MAILKKLAEDRDSTMTETLRQAVRLYQLVNKKQSEGYTFCFESNDGLEKSKVIIL